MLLIHCFDRPIQLLLFINATQHSKTEIEEMLQIYSLPVMLIFAKLCHHSVHFITHQSFAFY